MNTEGKANTKTGKKFALPPDAMFSQRALLALMFPLIIEQLLNSLMGTADTMMVSNVGSAAISGSIPCGFHQQPGATGIYRHGCRRHGCMLPVSGAQG